MAEARKLPSISFTTKHLRPHEQFDAWRENMAKIFDGAPAAGQSPKAGFKITGHAYALGEMIVGQAVYDGHRFVRDKRKIAGDGLDHYHVQLCTAGGLVNSLNGTDIVLQPNDVQIHNLGRPNNMLQKASGAIGVIVTREMLRAALPQSADPHGLVLRGNSALGGLLSSYLKSLMARLGEMTADDGPLLASATAQMIAACFHQTADTATQAQSTIDLMTLDRIKQFVAQNLSDPLLGPELLCAKSGTSRTTLYRLFESVGGVASYIREQRLIRAFRELRNPARRNRRISEIAADWGFASETHFSTLFRRTFGMSPSEARAGIEETVTMAPDIAVPGSSNGAFSEWIERLR